ncbi:hypothetical protein HPCPY3281_0510 [Helicobacter pylori CPY3281]|nr:hypothetical protein HPCPY3281_0510 [Helicobacter pylori CPY3281]
MFFKSRFYHKNELCFLFKNRVEKISCNILRLKKIRQGEKNEN